MTEWQPDIIIYHGGGCADGFGAAWACWRRWGADCEYIPASYGEAPPSDITDRNALIVDFSYKAPVLAEMAKVARSIVILDHHASAERELEEYRRFKEHPERFTLATVASMIADLQRGGYPAVCALFDMDRSGASMAWDFCHPGYARPSIVKLIEDRDLWRFTLELTRPFALWLRSEPFDFERWTDISYNLDRPYGNEIVREATAMQRFFDHKVEELAAYAEPGRIGEHTPVIVNCPPMFSSEVGNRLLVLHPDAPFAATYHDGGGKRRWSLRSDDNREDVSLIAESFGGGGHRNAAGFSTDLAQGAEA